MLQLAGLRYMPDGVIRSAHVRMPVQSEESRMLSGKSLRIGLSYLHAWFAGYDQAEPRRRIYDHA